MILCVTRKGSMKSMSNNCNSGKCLSSPHIHADEDDHHDDVIHYLQPLSKDELIALGRELGLGNARLSKMTDLAGIICLPSLLYV